MINVYSMLALFLSNLLPSFLVTDWGSKHRLTLFHHHNSDWFSFQLIGQDNRLHRLKVSVANTYPFHIRISTFPYNSSPSFLLLIVLRIMCEWLLLFHLYSIQNSWASSSFLFPIVPMPHSFHLLLSINTHFFYTSFMFFNLYPLNSDLPPSTDQTANLVDQHQLERALSYCYENPDQWLFNVDYDSVLIAISRNAYESQSKQK